MNGQTVDGRPAVWRSAGRNGRPQTSQPNRAVTVRLPEEMARVDEETLSRALVGVLDAAGQAGAIFDAQGRTVAATAGYRPQGIPRVEPAPDSRPRVELSVVLPVFNESSNLTEVYERLTRVLAGQGETYEIIFVDDGSSDDSLSRIQSFSQRDPHVRYLALSRNFGHQTAISAGIDHASGAAIAVMDADLQDPPEELPNLLAHWRQGYQVVYAVRRRRTENVFKRSAYSLFYRALRQTANVEIPLDAGDFCVIDRRVAEILRDMPERNRFVRGIRSWVGFRQIGVPYNRARRFAGKSQYSLFKLLRLAFDGIFSFSYLPLRLASLLGLLVSFAGFILSVWTVYKRLVLPQFPSGFATIVVGMMFLGGIQLIALGVIGEYVGRIFDEVKQRPLYLVRERFGFEDGPS